MRAYPLVLLSLVSLVSLSCTADLGPDPIAPVASLSIEPADATIEIGTWTQLSVVARDSSGAILSGRPVTWNSASSRIAIVGPTGTVYGMTLGTADVFATVGGKGAQAKVKVDSIHPPILVAVELNPASITLQGGATQQFAANGRMSNGRTVTVNVTYSATGGTITNGGLYTAGSVAGSYQVIATQASGTLADTSVVTVIPLPPTLVAVVLTPPSVTLQTGATQQFTASGQMSNGSTTAVNVTYSATGGTVTSAGFYTAGSVAGSYQVIATQTGGTLADTSVVTITSPNPAPPTLVAVVLTPPSVTLQSGATQQFAASGRMSDGSTAAVNVTYSATGGTIASGGLYTAGGTAGSYRVIATQAGGTLADTSAVTLTPPPPTLVAVVLTPPSVTLQSGATQQFAASGRMSDGSTAAVNVTYSPTGGTIASNGLYTAGGTAGSYRVIATQVGGTLADTSAVTVTSPPPTLVAVVLTPPSVTLVTGATQQFTATGQMSNGSTTAVNVTYSATGGTVTSAGFYTAGSVAGSYRVIIALVGGTLADTSAVTITAPGPCVGSATVVCPGESIQAKVNAAPGGTAFTIKAGIHRSQRLNPKSGDSFLGEPGAILDGEGVTQFAFEGGSVGVLIRNLEIRNYTTLCPTPDNCLGAIQAYNASDWTLENLNVHHNAGAGMNSHGRVTVRGGSFHHNARLGIGVSGGAGALIEGVELAYNNPDRLFDPLWEAGGIKVAAQGTDVTVRGCYVHHNVGPGIWYDIDNQRSVIENNTVTDNAYAGIFYEISYSGVIRGNTSTGNGTATTGPYGAGILVASSADVEVHHNTLRNNAAGIVAMQEQRSGQFGAYLITNLWVHDNNVATPLGPSGLIDLIGNGAVYSRNNRFTLNAYDITGNSLPFWIDRLVLVSRSTWQARGQDLNSTFTGP